MAVRVTLSSVCVIGLLVLMLLTSHCDAYSFREKSFRMSPYYRQYGGSFRRIRGDETAAFSETGNGNSENADDGGLDDEGGIYLSDLAAAEEGLPAAEKRSAMLQQLAQQLKNSRPREKAGFAFRFGKRESRSVS
ncbi:QRFP-like peptide [Branchiostoma floridae x Branchiostoma belcheri]